MTDDDLAWGAGEEMNAFESVMWRIEADPALRAPTLSCEVLDVVPDWDRLLAAHEWSLQVAPRFRQKVVEPAFGLGTPRWTTDEGFDLRYHLRRQTVPEGTGWAGFWAAVSQFAMTPLDRSRPPWEVVLYEGLPEGRAVYALKMHHSVTDGMGVMQLLRRLHATGRDHTPDKPVPRYDPPAEIDPVGALVHQVRADVAALPDAVRRVGATAAGVLRDPVGTATSTARYAASLKRVVTPPDAPGSPLLAGRSLSMRLAGIDLSFPEFRAAARAAGGSVNDAFLAALLGGYRRYHEAMAAPVAESVPTAMPVSLRTADDPEGGNRIASARFAGPMAERDPAARVARLREAVLAVRGEPALNVIGLASPVLARLPGPIVARVAGPMTKSNDLHASNVPGLGGEHYLAGARVERFYGYGPLAGGASLITFVSHGDVACVGVGFDPAAFTEPETFLGCLVDGFAEVLRLAPGAAEPALRV